MTVSIPADRLAIAIAKSRSWRGVSRYLHLRPSARTRAILIEAADRHGLDHSHFTTSHNAGRVSRRAGFIIGD